MLGDNSKEKCTSPSETKPEENVKSSKEIYEMNENIINENIKENINENINENIKMTKPPTSFELERDWRSFESQALRLLIILINEY